MVELPSGESSQENHVRPQPGRFLAHVNDFSYSARVYRVFFAPQVDNSALHFQKNRFSVFLKSGPYSTLGYSLLDCTNILRVTIVLCANMFSHCRIWRQSAVCEQTKWHDKCFGAKRSSRNNQQTLHEKMKVLSLSLTVQTPSIAGLNFQKLETLTTNDVQGAGRNVRKDVKLLAFFDVSQFLNEDFTLVIENVQEVVQNSKMESWR